MGSPVSLRDDFDAAALRSLARRTRDASQGRRLLALAAIYDGGSRGDAARIGSVGLQTVRDWVLRFNAAGPAGLGRRQRRRGRRRGAQRGPSALLDDGDEDVDRDGNPDLRLHRVLRRAVELLDPKMLLDPLEEEFRHLPAAFVERADGGGRKRQVVGDEDQRLAGLGVLEADAPQKFGVILTGVEAARRLPGLSRAGPIPSRAVHGVVRWRLIRLGTRRPMGLGRVPAVW